jgi:hypothetical protein
MSLTKSKGNMYGWVTHQWPVLAGACPHGCHYCYVQAMAKRFPVMAHRYATGPLRLIHGALETKLGSGRTIFVEHLNDLWAGKVPDSIIAAVLQRCREFPGNTYVFQTKNPERYREFFGHIPAGSILGTTIESNAFHHHMGNAPFPLARAVAMRLIKGFRRFFTIEPIMDFDLLEFAQMLTRIHPEFINIGADSKGGNLPEPSGDKIRALIALLEQSGIEVRQKPNLARLLQTKTLTP